MLSHNSVAQEELKRILSGNSSLTFYESHVVNSNEILLLIVRC